MRLICLFFIILLSACNSRTEEGLTKYQADKMAKSAKASGNMEDYYNAGKAYCCGKAEVRDAALSLKSFCAVAKKNYKYAQKELGDLYRKDKKAELNNSGFPDDDLVAYAWYSMAAAQKISEAVDGQYEVAARLSFDELKKAKEYVSLYPAIPCGIK